MKKVKLIIERKFPKFHRREGEETEFEEKILDGRKKHSVQSNFSKWKTKIDKLNNEKGSVSVEVWTGTPYLSEKLKIKEIKNVKIQSLEFKNGKYLIDGHIETSLEEIATNEGLLLEDFRDWFKVFPVDKMAVIQLDNNFKYS